jgi:hypothetical protein
MPSISIPTIDISFRCLTKDEQKIRERQLPAPAESETLQDLVRNELKTKSHKATEGLLWLVRYVGPLHIRPGRQQKIH